jgi:hypothetical protein
MVIFDQSFAAIHLSLKYEESRLPVRKEINPVGLLKQIPCYLFEIANLSFPNRIENLLLPGSQGFWTNLLDK